MNLKGLLHSESRVVLGLSRKQSIQENSGDANNDKHSLHRLLFGKGKHIKKSYVAIVLYFSTRDLPDIATSEKKKKKKKIDQLSRFSSKSFVEKKKKT